MTATMICRFLSSGFSWVARQSARISSLLTIGMLAVSYFVLITPLAMIFRFLGRDLLRLRRTPEARSAWKPSDSGASEPNMLRPF
jgi:TRAP-type C4-dicarboxylate transport system permease small subunit